MICPHLFHQCHGSWNVAVNRRSFSVEIYFASADLEATRKNRSEAIHRVAGLVAERVVDAVDLEVKR